MMERDLLPFVLKAVTEDKTSDALAAFETDESMRIREAIAGLEERMKTPPLNPDTRIAEIDRLVKLRSLADSEDKIYARAWDRLSRAMEAVQSPVWRGPARSR